MEATVYRVAALRDPRNSLAGLDHFELSYSDALPARTLLDLPNLSLYSFDDTQRQAVFVETPADIDLAAAPFYYRAQKEHARRVFTVSYTDFNTLAKQLAAPPHLIFLHSVGRCGSTLLCKALGELGEVTSLSEPDVYTCAVGMREPDGSRDTELMQLLASATRFLGRRTENKKLIIKFRGWCLEVADLLAQAYPQAHNLFLGRDVEGWIRSMGRLLKLKDPAREAQYQQQGKDTPMHGYPRERFISLLQRSTFTPDTWLEDVTLGWVSLTTRYLELFREGVITHALTYDDLTGRPREALHVVATACHLSVNDLDAALAIFEHDAQTVTHFSGSALREQKLYELEPSDIERAENVARRHGLEPTLTSHLPGNLLER